MEGVIFLNRFVNPIVRAILHSPLHGLLSGRLLLLTYTRGNGEPRTIPVGYARDGDAVRISVGGASHKRWWRAVRRNPDVTLLIRGVRRTGSASVVVGDPVTVEVNLGGRVSSAVP
jgi:hypothetical protein